MDPASLGHIGVLMGGYSTERDVSLRSGQAVCQALEKAGCRVTPVNITAMSRSTIKQQVASVNMDVAFIALHGVLGEDGRIQEILEELALPYTGPGVEASRIAFHKGQTSKLLSEAGIAVPPFKVFQTMTDIEPEQIIQALGGFPVMVKPTCEVSSIGVVKAQTPEQLMNAARSAFGYGHEVIIEQFIDGREVTVGILGRETLPVVEVKFNKVFFDFDAKYENQETTYDVPAHIPEVVSQQLQGLAIKVYYKIGAKGMSRIDFRLDTDGRPFVLEVNTIPGFTPKSLLPKAAQAAGYSFEQLCMRLVEIAYGEKT